MFGTLESQTNQQPDWHITYVRLVLIQRISIDYNGFDQFLKPDNYRL